MKVSLDIERRCSFCGKKEEDVDKIISGPAAIICDECIALGNGIMWNHYQSQINELEIQQRRFAKQKDN